ncbi:MAG: hypothetical protein IKI77_02620 [Oscillospiraceae bacterium]|nr:hypothetical protein [Oscillospiraceae bacterium]
MKIGDANRITLNALKEILNPAIRKPEFLAMLFPPALRETDRTDLLAFIYDTSTVFRNARTSFLNGNIVRYPKKDTFSRAHQSELSLIANYLRSEDAYRCWTAHLAQQFPCPDAAALDALLPQDSPRYPAAFAELLDRTAPVHEKLLLLILWSIFGELIASVSGIFRISERSPQEQPQPTAQPQVAGEMMRSWSTMEYFDKVFQGTDQITQLDMAFHEGENWLSDGERIAAMLDLIRQGARIRILLDDEAASAPLSEHINNKDRFSIPCELNYRNWLAFQQRYPEAVEVRIAPVPVLRNYTCFSFAEPEKGSMRVVFYTYGNFFFGQYYSIYPPSDSAPYELFRIEFAHLWEHSKPIAAHLAEIDS